MFTATIPEVQYVDPWISPLSLRLKQLGRGKFRIAYFYEQANNSTFRYRAYNMAQVLNDGNGCEVSASYFFLADLGSLDEISKAADMLVICRSGYSHKISQLITRFKSQKKRVLFDTDDLIFDTRYAHLIMNTLDQDVNKPELWDYWFAYLSRMGETLRMCDAAVTTNDFLAGKIKEFSGLPVGVIPNFINKEQLAISESIYAAKKLNQFGRDDRICLGYFSGSPSHNLDYEIIIPALELVMDSDPQVDLMVVGYIDAGVDLSKFGNRIKRQPFHDYVNLQRLIGSVELNLMPLQANCFTDCKSDLKYFESAIVGTVSVASPSYTYRASVRHGNTGYIALAHEWTKVLQAAIKDINDYPLLAENAYTDSYARYAWKNQRERIIQVLLP